MDYLCFAGFYENMFRALDRGVLYFFNLLCMIRLLSEVQFLVLSLSVICLHNFHYKPSHRHQMQIIQALQCNKIYKIRETDVLRALFSKHRALTITHILKNFHLLI